MNGNRIFLYLKNYRYQIILAITIVFICIVIELKYNYFFLQDDNRDYFLPLYIANLRALLGGEIPLFNFHQHCGTPLLAIAQSATFYPLNYMALILSKIFWGHYFATIDIIVILHIIIGGIGFFYLLRSFGLHERSSFFGALAWSFCGFFVSVGNSWVPISGYGAYLPWLSFLIIRILRKNTIKDFIWLCVIRCLLFFIGWQQYFIYTITFEIAFIIFIMLFYSNHLGDRLRQQTRYLNINFDKKNFVKSYLLHFVFVALIVLPCLLPSLHQVDISYSRNAALSWLEYRSLSYDLRDWVVGLFNPFSERGYTYNWTNQNFISHIGYVTIFFIFIILFYLDKRNYRLILVYLLLALLTLLFASGTFLTKLFYYIPIYNRFRWPFKVVFFTTFSLIIIASIGFDIFYRKYLIKGKGTLIFICLIIVHLLNFIVIYIFLPQRMFGVHLDKIPLYEKLEEPLKKGRIITIGPKYFNLKVFPGLYGYTAPYLGFNYATLWGLYHFGGYEPLLSKKNHLICLGLNYSSNLSIDTARISFEDQKLLLEYFRKWGVKWYIVEKNIKYAFFNDLNLYHSDNFRNIFYDSLASNLIYFMNNITTGSQLKYNINTNTIYIKSSNNFDDYLIINFVFNDYFAAYLDGQRVKLIETEDHQMMLFVPKGEHLIVIEYSDPFFTFGFIITGGFIFVLCVLIIFRRNKLSKYVFKIIQKN